MRLLALVALAVASARAEFQSQCSSTGIQNHNFETTPVRWTTTSTGAPLTSFGRDMAAKLFNDWGYRWIIDGTLVGDLIQVRSTRFLCSPGDVLDLAFHIRIASNMLEHPEVVEVVIDAYDGDFGPQVPGELQNFPISSQITSTYGQVNITKVLTTNPLISRCSVALVGFVATAAGLDVSGCDMDMFCVDRISLPPTPEPPTLAPTPAPTPGPPPPPVTPQPTPGPTLGPTPAPTPNPTPVPTSQPTPNPTPVPTLQPTAQPTSQPTSIPPTAQPTVQPTPAPTPAPTPEPDPTTTIAVVIVAIFVVAGVVATCVFFVVSASNDDDDDNDDEERQPLVPAAAALPVFTVRADDATFKWE